MSNLKHTIGLWNRGKKTKEEIDIISSLSIGIIKTYKEFRKIKNLKTTSLRDTIYLEEVLTVLDTYLRPPIEKATGQKIGKLING